MAATGTSLTKLVPGFEFLQGLVKNAGAAIPSVGQWIAPTLDPAEIDKRIEELRTVQFWLEQNARMCRWRGCARGWRCCRRASSPAR